MFVIPRPEILSERIFKLTIITIFIINLLSGITGTLKSIFTSKNQAKELYIITIIDTTLYALIIQGISTGQGIPAIIAFVSGKLTGVYLGTKLEQFMGLGIIKIELFVNQKTTMANLGDDLRKNGYTANTSVLYGIKGQKRYKIEVTTKSKNLKKLYRFLKGKGITNPTYIVHEINQVGGKINV